MTMMIIMVAVCAKAFHCREHSERIIEGTGWRNIRQKIFRQKLSSSAVFPSPLASRVTPPTQQFMTATRANPTGSRSFTPKATSTTTNPLHISDQYKCILCRQMDLPSTRVSSPRIRKELVVREMRGAMSEESDLDYVRRIWITNCWRKTGKA